VLHMTLASTIGGWTVVELSAIPPLAAVIIVGDQLGMLVTVLAAIVSNVFLLVVLVGAIGTLW